MYQVIARKYRPATFSELISQEHVRTTLENAIRQGRIAHGYIFSGQRGTGKTTVARILARCLNCIKGPTAEPCGECSSCREIAGGSAIDVIEIDAASNRGINEMRELRENVRFRPARDRYKVFIIDEAHQITSEAFNALLKTLEEPPEWVVFILCTTETHKIPVTIASRCQQFSFRSVDFAELMDRMRWICQQEGIQADDESLAVLAQAGEGSVRDSLSALDQAIACCGTALSATELRALLGRFGIESLRQITDALEAGDGNRMLGVVQELESNGHNLQHFCRELARYFRNLLVSKVAGQESRLISASAAEQERLREIAGKFSEEDLTRYLQLTLDLFKDLQVSLQPRLHMELGLLKLVHAGRLVAIEEALANMGSSRPAAAMPAATRPPAAPPPPARPSGPSPFQRDSARKSAAGPAASAAPAPAREPSSAPGSIKSALHGALVTLGMTHAADKIEISDVREEKGEVIITAPESARMLTLQEADLKKALQSIGRQPRVKITFGEVQSAPAPEAKAVAEGELEQRALSDPGVRRFQELFPDAHIRAIRNLRQD
jgi:DNA polymerase-3 subunit gamma/tau